MHYDDPKIVALLRAQGVEPNFVPKLKKRRNNEESRSQQAVIKWWSVAHIGYRVPECALFAIGNGGKRDAVTGAIMKREGVRAGVSDLFLSVPRSGFHGMYLEMKKSDGRLSQDQVNFCASIGALGYAVQVAFSTDQAVRFIDTYLGL